MYPHKHLTTLQACADKLAAKKDWPSLYNPEALRNTSVPTAAAMYYDDIYVDRLLSEQTAALVGSAPGATPIKVWVTNEYQHTGIRDDGYIKISVFIHTHTHTHTNTHTHTHTHTHT